MTNTANTDPDLAATVHHAGGSYPVVAGWGILDQLGDRLTAWASAVRPTSSPTKT